MKPQTLKATIKKLPRQKRSLAIAAIDGALYPRLKKMQSIASTNCVFTDYELMMERGRFVMVTHATDQPICFRPMTVKSAARWVLEEIVPSQLRSAFKIV